MLNECTPIKDHTAMNTNMLIQELYIPEIRKEQLQKAVQGDMIRLALANRPSLATRMLDAIGAMLMAAGESLRQQPASTDGTRSTISYAKS
jgi:hypothetical protein